VAWRLYLLAVFALCVVVPGSRVRAEQASTAYECSLTGKGAFSIGWTETVDAQQYRCPATFDGALKRAGTAWVKVDAEGRPLVP
jgi:hypothetical protein